MSALTAVTFASAAVVGGMGAFVLFDRVRRSGFSNMFSGEGILGLGIFGVGSALATSGDSPRTKRIVFHYR
jgi:hypothetical protein